MAESSGSQKFPLAYKSAMTRDESQARHAQQGVIGDGGDMKGNVTDVLGYAGTQLTGEGAEQRDGVDEAGAKDEGDDNQDTNRARNCETPLADEQPGNADDLCCEKDPRCCCDHVSVVAQAEVGMKAFEQE